MATCGLWPAAAPPPPGGGAFGLCDTSPACSTYQIALAAGPEVNPQVLLSVSDDGGRTWSTLKKPRSMGKIGEYRTRLRWLKMGSFRQRIVRLEIADRVRKNIIGIYVDARDGLG